MKKNVKLLNKVARAYPGNSIDTYFDMKTGRETNSDGGDTLALYIGREAVLANSKPELIGFLEQARDDIEKTILCLEGRFQR